MAFRHEWKHALTPADALAARGRLRIFLQPDPHAGSGGTYGIRSLYFDTPEDKALREKLDGVNRREKFRIRYYNGDASLIHLEKKIKVNGLCGKRSTLLSQSEAQAIIDGELDWMLAARDRPLVTELYAKMKTQGLRPKTIVDYIREPYVYAPGNVRVTLDSRLRTGLRCTDFLNAGCVTIPVPDTPVILEVKWDEYLPSVVRAAVQLGNRQAAAFSKYAACRIYG